MKTNKINEKVKDTTSMHRPIWKRGKTLLDKALEKKVEKLKKTEEKLTQQKLKFKSKQTKLPFRSDESIYERISNLVDKVVAPTNIFQWEETIRERFERSVKNIKDQNEED